jgi:hypothetical protein
MHGLSGRLLAVSFASAAAARHALVLDDLSIKVVLGLDNAAKEHPAVHAGVGASFAAAVLCMVDPHGQKVLAVLPAVREVRAVAGLFAIIDRVEAPARAAGHEVEVLADVADLVAAGTVESQESVQRPWWRREFGQR